MFQRERERESSLFHCFLVVSLSLILFLSVFAPSQIKSAFSFPGVIVTEYIFASYEDEQHFGEVDGNKIIWNGYGSAGKGVYVYNTTTQSTSNLSNSGTEYACTISNGAVAWCTANSSTHTDEIYYCPRDEENARKIREARQKAQVCELDIESSEYGDRVFSLEKFPLQGISQNNIYCWDSLLDASLLVCDGSSNKIGLTIYNNYVFWSDDRTGNYDIWAYDFNSGLTFAFVSAPEDQVLVPCQGFDNNIGSNFIVWQDGRNCSEQNPNNYDIYGKNLITGQIFIVSNSVKNEIEPVASGNKISWIEKDIIVDQNGKQTGWHDTVKTKDTGTGIISTISTSDTYKESICMNDDFIIWSESPDLNLINSTWDLKGYSNELFIEFPISIHSGDQFALSLSGNFVFWQDTRNDDGDLFYATLVVQP